MKLNEKGISLINVMIGIGITSVMGLAVMRMSQNASQSQQSMKASADFLEFTNHIRSKFNSRDYCKTSLAGAITYTLPYNATNESKTAVNKLIKPTYTINATTGVKNLTGSVDEYVIPLGVDLNDPSTGLQYGNLSLMAMELVRMPGSDDVFLELHMQKRNHKAMGGRDLKKRIPLQVYFNTSDEIESCFSAFDNFQETVFEEFCKNSLGGEYNYDGDPTTNDCTGTDLEEEVCQQKAEIRALKGITGAVPDCPLQVSISTETIVNITSASSSTFTIPTDIIPGTVSASLLGGGGGGGGGDYARPGGGGKEAGKIENQSLAALGGNDTCSYTVGAGGGGGDGAGSATQGSNGAQTQLTCPKGINLTASGGDGGCAECRSGAETGWAGEGITFLLTWYNAGNGGGRGNNGAVGQSGAGGGGGGDRYGEGGAGGSGILKVTYQKASITAYP